MKQIFLVCYDIPCSTTVTKVVPLEEQDVITLPFICCSNFSFMHSVLWTILCLFSSNFKRLIDGLIDGGRPMIDENKFTSHQYHLEKSDTRVTLGQKVAR